MQNFGSTLNQADIYPLSAVVAPGAQPPDVQTASGKVPSNEGNAAGLSFVSILVVLVLIRVAYEFSEGGE